MSTLDIGRSLAQRKQRPSALSGREQLALTLLADEWSNAQLKMCFEVSDPSKYAIGLSEQSVREIARFEAERARREQ